MEVKIVQARDNAGLNKSVEMDRNRMRNVFEDHGLVGSKHMGVDGENGEDEVYS